MKKINQKAALKIKGINAYLKVTPRSIGLFFSKAHDPLLALVTNIKYKYPCYQVLFLGL